jgi:glucosyl-3-phosphoglycerate synthase
MGDFYQTGIISTLHRLGQPNIDKLEKDLKKVSRQNPVALILPCLYSELQGEAIGHIIQELRKVTYLRQVVITMTGMDSSQFADAKKYFSVLPQEKRVIWNNGPAIQALYEQLSSAGVGAGADGKGRSAWMAMGFVLGDEKSDVIALHDCDILTYNREMLARLCYPVAHPSLAYEFAKGYYARYTDRLHGRVTRLFMTPLIRSLQKVVGFLPLLVFLDSFRYPLSGEFAMTTDLARVNRIPGDWGLEVGVLAEIHRNCAVRRVCEVDLCEVYEHKHQALDAADASKGILKMVTDIAKSLFRTLGSEGTVLSEGALRTVKATYLRMAQDQIKRYADDAAINGLSFDRHAEGTSVEAFAKAIESASKQYMEDPLGAPMIPNWSRVTSAIPDFLDRLKVAVEQDNAN